MLPRFPARLRPVDANLRSEHSQLGPDDECDYLWEYVPRRPSDWTAGNQLIRDLKLTPSALARQPSRLRYKHAAIVHAGRALRRVLPADLVLHATFVPMPCSKARGRCDHDDRMLKVLRCALRSRGDVRELLQMQRSVTADHECRVRCTPGQLRRLLRLDEDRRVADAVALAPGSTIVLVDDVLNSGKHFRVASELLRRRFPGCHVRGLFLARCVREGR